LAQVRVLGGVEALEHVLRADVAEMAWHGGIQLEPVGRRALALEMLVYVDQPMR
jgi:hypothetical protein